MKILTKAIKTTFILAAISCASVCIMPNMFYDVMPVCAASEVSASDEERIIQELQQKAEAGDANSQYEVAFYYAYGIGIEKDDTKAAYWYKKAAIQENPSAQFSLALCYFTGTGVPKDEIHALHWLKNAAEQNHPEAQFQLGICYLNGSVVKTDTTQAYYWIKKAADQGHLFAIKFLKQNKN